MEACWASCIEPETSMRKTRLLKGPLALVDRPPLDADPGEPVVGVPGQPAISTRTENGSSPAGAGSS